MMILGQAAVTTIVIVNAIGAVVLFGVMLRSAI